MQHLKPTFPTKLHQNAAKTVYEYFSQLSSVDTILIVNSCARGQAVAESDLDIAILAKEHTPDAEIDLLYTQWQQYSLTHPVLQQYKKSNAFYHLHLDITNGRYEVTTIEASEPMSFFEVEVGNQVCYAAPFGDVGFYFKKLQQKWLPYYDEALRIERLKNITTACLYDLDHVPHFIKRGLYFQAFDILYKALQEYLQSLFIANQTYPIAYNKWIKYQVVDILNKPDVYSTLAIILSIDNFESDEMNLKAGVLRELLLNL